MEVATLEMVRAKVDDLAKSSVIADRPALETVLDTALDTGSGISMLLVSVSDGRSIAHRSHRKVDPRRLSAMSNSFLTLGETLSRELGLSTADHVTISTSQGSMVLVRVVAGRIYTLAALGYPDTPLAKLLYAARETATRLKPLL